MKSTEPRIRDVSLEDIDRSRNHRIPRPGDAERLEAMKKSIEACDQLQPIRVYKRGDDQQDKKHKEPYILGFGNRRCRAMELLARKTIMAIVCPPATDAEIAQARAVENAAKEQVFKKINGHQDQTPEAIRKVSPEWLKGSTVVAFVKRKLEKANSREEEPTASKSKAVIPGRRLTDHELALQKFAEAFNAWEVKAYKAVLKGINSDPLYRVNWCVLLGVSTFWEQTGIKIPRVETYNTEPCTLEPVLPPLSEEVEQAIRSAFKGTRNSWVDLLKDYEQVNPNQRGGLMDFHPRALELLVEVMKVKVPAMPQWKPVSTPTASSAETNATQSAEAAA